MDPRIFAGVALAAVVIYKLLAGRRSPEELTMMRAAVMAGGVLVDVRTPREFAGGHPDGAVNIPLGELARRAEELGAKDRPIVVCCASGTRSRSAVGLLRQAGFTRVMDLGPHGNWSRRAA